MRADKDQGKNKKVIKINKNMYLKLFCESNKCALLNFFFYSIIIFHLTMSSCPINQHTVWLQITSLNLASNQGVLDSHQLVKKTRAESIHELHNCQIVRLFFFFPFQNSSMLRNNKFIHRKSLNYYHVHHQISSLLSISYADTFGSEPRNSSS